MSERTRKYDTDQPDTPEAPEAVGGNGLTPNPTATVRLATPPFHDRLVVHVDGRDEPVVVTSTGTDVPSELVEHVRTAAAASHLKLRETH